jgi:phage gpG-like protein
MAKTFQYKGRDYNFGRIVPRLTEVRNHLPEVLATTALNFFKDSFRRQGWRDKGLKRWASRKDGSRPGGAILVKRGHLRNSLRKILATWQRTEVGTNLPYAAAHNEGFKGTVNVKAHTRRKFKTTTTTEGRGVFNIKTRKELTRTKKRKEETGATYGVRAHTRQMNLEQRQFMGDSEMLDRKIDHVIASAVDTIFDV